jgi:hypothetical protein
MKIATIEILPKLFGIFLWIVSIVYFPVLWATTTIAIGLYQITQCQKTAKAVNKLYFSRTKLQKR